MEHDASYYYLLGHEAQDKGEFDSALRHYFKSLCMDSHFKTHHRIAQIYKEMGQTTDAFDHLVLAFELNPRNDKVAVDYAQAFCEKGNSEEAKNILTQLLERNASYGPASRMLASLSGER